MFRAFFIPLCCCNCGLQRILAYLMLKALPTITFVAAY